MALRSSIYYLILFTCIEDVGQTIKLILRQAAGNIVARLIHICKAFHMGRCCVY